ncbi:PHP domain-containing protein [Intrasporangium calvum]|uniref:PHP domain-containing protein n=1 Tax=Intrasporangium calvum TaxID=53358 RepID=A0ABT5GL53_9MICO|nr:PHP domain-containing protein [Intrasporangium calvum]MDC5698620.1 PHP domain-containing protein [Intrasporangium calvum]
MSPAAPVIDLHAHSTASDGTDTPAELVSAARQAGIDVLAITDHDTVAGWAEAAQAARSEGISLVRGIEVSTTYRDASIHVLGYLTDPDDAALMGELAKARDSRATRLERMVDLMAADGIPITYPEVLAQVAPGATPGRPHIADALIANGTIRHRDEAFRDWLTNESPYYVSHYSPDPVRACELVRRAGGVPVLAHPFTRTRGATVTEALIEQMYAAGLAGLEAFHRDHGPSEVERALALARRLGLVVTGSSDYHGTGKVNRLAEHTTDPEVLAVIESQASGVTPVVRP